MKIRTWFMISCSKCLNATVELMEEFTEKGIKFLGPFFIALAIGIISTVAYVYFFLLMPELERFNSDFFILFNKSFALIILFNILFNYFSCICTSPGTTESIDQNVLYSMYTPQWRFCLKCNKPKPHLSHHCSICNKCVLKMDHHCPWVANCIGYKNYRYFFLFLFYLALGCLYMFWMMVSNYQRIFIISHSPLLLFSLLLSASVGVAVGILLFWHFFLVLTAQGTLDAFQNFRHWRLATSEGRVWKNPHSAGPLKNFQNAFDVDSGLWWIEWLLPSIKPKRGHGIYIIEKDLEKGDGI